MKPDTPDLSVVLCTFRRPETVARALASLLVVPEPRLEVVVADAGDPVETAAALSGLADDDRWRLVPVDDLGLALLRNHGAREARGRWIGFLDDDDWVEPDWVSSMLKLASIEGSGLWSCGAILVDPDAGSRTPLPAGSPTPLFGSARVNVLAGCWIVRRDIFDAVGGFLPGLMWSHQTELLLRLTPTCGEMELGIGAIDRPLVNITRQPPSRRRLSSPRNLLDGTRWILARHHEAFSRSPDDLADYLNVTGVNAARVGAFSLARRSFARSIRTRPRIRTVARLAICAVPSAAPLIWPSVSDQSRNAGLGHALADVVNLADGRPATESIFLPWKYRQNPGPSEDDWHAVAWSPDVQGAESNRSEVHQWAAKEARRLRLRVIEVGRGLGPPHSPTKDPSPEGLVLCCGLIERVPDPRALLEDLHRLAAGFPVILSIEERSPADGSGPPLDRSQIRQWTRDELELLVESTGWRVLRSRRLTAERAPRLSVFSRLTARALGLPPVRGSRRHLVLHLQGERR